MVDSTPMSLGPPSSTSRFGRPGRRRRAAAVVGLGLEKRFALGAATGTPAISISARATRCAGHTHRHVRQAGGHHVGIAGCFRENQRQRARPERQAELARSGRHARGHLRQLPDVRDVHNQRIGGRALLGLEDPRHRHRDRARWRRGRRRSRWETPRDGLRAIAAAASSIADGIRLVAIDGEHSRHHVVRAGSARASLPISSRITRL